MHYKLIRSEVNPNQSAGWSHPFWSAAEEITLSHFHKRSTAHRPRTSIKALYSVDGLHVIFRVEDHYIRSVQTELHSPVHTDSCVEFFVRPKSDAGYFNFEVNAGGHLHASFIEDWKREGSGFAKSSKLSSAEAALIQLKSSEQAVIEPEQVGPHSWTLQLFIPFALFEIYLGVLGDPQGQEWTANFYKCGDKTSHPHWASWSPIEGELNFHQPAYFGTLQFT